MNEGVTPPPAPKHPWPPREWLIVSIAYMVAKAVEDEYIVAARRNRIVEDYATDPTVIEIRQILECIKERKPFTTDDRNFRDRLAYAQQFARISYEEWEANVKLLPNKET